MDFLEVWRDLSTNSHDVAFDKCLIYPSCVCFLLCLDVLSDSWLSAFDCGLCDFLTFIKTLYVVCGPKPMFEALTLTNTTSDKEKVLQRVSAAAD